MTTRSHFVYRVYAADDSLLYVGCSSRPMKRLSEHRSQSEWGALGDHVRMRGPLARPDALALERQQQLTLRPRFGCPFANRQLSSTHLLRALVGPDRGKKMSGRQLAREVGCHRSFIDHLLTGRRTSCTPGTAERISAALAVPTDVLFDRLPIEASA